MKELDKILLVVQLALECKFHSTNSIQLALIVTMVVFILHLTLNYSTCSNRFNTIIYVFLKICEPCDPALSIFESLLHKTDSMLKKTRLQFRVNISFKYFCVSTHAHRVKVSPEKFQYVYILSLFILKDKIQTTDAECSVTASDSLNLK